MIRKSLLLLLLPAMLAADETPVKSECFYRHKHFFLVWNDQKEPPKITLTTKRFGNYQDTMSYQIINAGSEVLTEGDIPPDSQREVSGVPNSPKYLIAADPGMNGVALKVNRPYGIVGSRLHPLGLNHPVGRLFLYVPASCNGFTIFTQSASPHEGGWVKVLRPDGALAGEAEGELDRETPIKIAVPEDCRDKVWTIEFDKPKTPGVGLDDLNLFVEGNLAPLFVPEKDWAERYARTVKFGEK